MIEERVTERKGVEGMHLHAMCTMWHTRLVFCMVDYGCIQHVIYYNKTLLYVSLITSGHITLKIE